MGRISTEPEQQQVDLQQAGAGGGRDPARRWIWLIATGWTLLLVLAFWWNAAHIRKTVKELARTTAITSFEKDVLYRQWATMHGGVYVLATEKTAPNPYLKGIPERDITTPSGRHLTLMNPEYVTREVYELGRDLYRHRGHITSLKPIRPENRPDAWERRALESFERGATEYSSIEPIDGESYFRLMRPFKTTAGCLKCHAAQGYREGDIRGGISVSVPLREYEAVVQSPQMAELVAHAGLWGFGLALLYGGSRHYLRRRLERDRAMAALEEGKMRFHSLFEDSPVALWEEDFSAVQRRLAELRAHGVTDLRAHFDQNPSEVARLAGLVRVVEVNRASVQLFGARSKTDLVRDLPCYFTAESLPVFAAEVLALAEGHRRFKAEAPLRNATGDPVVIELSLAVQPGHEESLSSVLVSFVDITERKRVAAALRYSESLLSQSQSVALIGHYVLDVATGTWSSSPVLDALFGIGPEYPKTVQGWLDLVHPDERRTMEDYLGNHVIREGKSFDKEYRIIRPSDGADRWMHGLGRLLKDPGGVTTQMFGTIQDITERKVAEEEREKLQVQLTQAQKMESIGRLAGGIAHDFNNLLTVINGYSEVALGELPTQNATRRAVEQIHDAGLRAANLTSQLLAFSRKQVISPRTIDVNRVVTDAGQMLQHLIGADIELKFNLAPHLGLAMADPVQLHQAILNLAINARDAMPEGGRLEITTANVELNEPPSAHPDAAPGHYVQLAIADTGIGMTEELRRQIFEPFFTTKEQGKGTGLGLAMVYGIVQQSNGWIEVESKPGLGSAFRIYLPRVEACMAAAEGRIGTAKATHGDETVLIVEDEDAVRSLAKTVLTARGYRVLEAANGEEAHEEARRHDGEIHLLLSDVVMPGMNGRVLSEQLRALRPNLRVVLMSGYAEDVVAHRGVLTDGLKYLQKPFTPDELASLVRQVLDSPAGAWPELG